ncbi:MAG: transcription antitermination factor NusB [Fibrobacterales bacterium]
MAAPKRTISKRQARVMAMQALYALDVTGSTIPQVLPGVIESLDPKEEQKKYGMDLIDLAVEHNATITETITTHSENWDLERIAVLDNVIIRVAVTELLYVKEIPPKVAISEAVAIAKKYSTEESGSFINGVLAGIAKPLFKE